ncbi:MAG: VOC family protein [Bacteroidaceae bacterium]|nr:VOC family protein [Bacteroidaceae bacterium]
MLNELSFHHIGIACFTIEESKAFYEQLGYKASQVVDDPIQDIRICFLEKQGMPLLELLAPIDQASPVNRILETQGVTPYHICYEVNDFDTLITILRKEHKFVRVSKPAPACAINNRRVAFMFRKDVGLIELLESDAK